MADSVWELKFGSNGTTVPAAADGWSHPEIDLVWMIGEESTIKCPPIIGDGVFALTLRLMPFVHRGWPFQTVQIAVNDVNCASLVVRQEGDFELFLPPAAYRDKPELKIKLIHSFHASPAQFGGSTDQRELAVAVKSITLERIGQHPADQLLAEVLEGDRVTRVCGVLPDVRANMWVLRDNFYRRARDFYYDKAAPLGALMQRFSTDVFQDEQFRADISAHINTRARTEQKIAANESLFDAYWRIKPELYQSINGIEIPAQYKPLPPDSRFVHTVFPGSANEWQDETIPKPINLVMKRALRDHLNIYFAENCQLYIQPHAYQLFDRKRGAFWPSASPRAASRVIERAPNVPTTRNQVILRDRFSPGNFAHFLFDAMTRLGHFVQANLAPVDSCDFIFGTVPGEFQALLLEAASRLYGITHAQWIFPTAERILDCSGRVFWFSDQVDQYLHPAQMAHPKSIAVLRELSGQVKTEAISSSARLYISRRDAHMRRIVNEAELVAALAARGFEAVALAEFPMEEQVARVRQARQIVAPHGMGLTHCTLHQSELALLEIFTPVIGSDAYTLMSRAMGFQYDYLIGEAQPGPQLDYSVDVAAVIAKLANMG